MTFRLNSYIEPTDGPYATQLVNRDFDSNDRKFVLEVLEVARKCDNLLNQIQLKKNERTWSNFLANALEGREGILKKIHEIFKTYLPRYQQENRKRILLEQEIDRLHTNWKGQTGVFARHKQKLGI